MFKLSTKYDKILSCVNYKISFWMGGGASINYCVPVTQKPEGESAIYRAPGTKDKLCDRP